MNKVLKHVTLLLLVIGYSASFCYGQVKENSYHAPYYHARLHALHGKYDSLHDVIADLPYSVEENQNLNFYISDFLIIRRAESILSDTSVWDRHDDRQCRKEGEGKYSLFCALEKASQEVTGEYLHRRTVMQEVRLVIVKYFKNRFNLHRLMDFNNNPETTFQDIRFVLTKAEETIGEQLEGKQQILNVIHASIDDINDQEFQRLRSLFSEKASAHYLWTDQDSVMAGRSIPFFLSKVSSKPVSEKVSGLISVSVGRNMGTAWVPCQLWSRESLLYHGKEMISLLKSKNKWKITSVNYSIQAN